MKILPLFLNLLTFLVNLFLGVLVFSRNPKKKINCHFALLAFFIGIWSLALLFYEYPVIFSSLIWLRIVYVLVFGIVFEIFFLSYIFPEEKKFPAKVTVIIYLLTAVFFSYIIIFTDLHIYKVIKTVTGYKTIVGLLYPFYPITLIIFSGIGFLNFASKFARSRGLAKIQVLYLLCGLMFFSFMSVIFDVIVPLSTGSSDLFVLSPSTSVIFIGLTAYSIVKHRFLDIRLIAARSVAYSLLVFIIGIFYAAGFFILSNIFVGPTSSQGLWVSTFLALIVAFTFQPLRRQLEKFTNGIFYKDHYDSRLLLEKLGQIMASEISLEELTSNLLTELFSQLKITQGALLLIKDKHITWVKTLGFNKAPKFSEEEIEKLMVLTYSNNRNKRGNPLTFFEEQNEGEIKDILRHNNFSLIASLTTKQGPLGLLVLGEKASGEIYFAEDLEILEILVPQIAVAVQNSLAYEEIRRFSAVLKEEVNQATVELQKANLRLKELSLLKDEFVSIASHELRTPMTTIKSYLWLVLNKAKNLDEKVKRDLQIAYESTERTIILVKDMLTVSRIEGNRLDINFSAFDLKELASQVVGELKIKAGERNIKLAIRPFSEDLVINGDRDKIGEVFQNIIGNALKFTPERGNVEVYFQKKNKMVEVSVSDDGSGISKKDISKLFQKFSRLGSSLSKMAETPGTGLGLYIAKQIVGLHKGKIWVESIVGKGSTFTFSLPLGERTYVGRK